MAKAEKRKAPVAKSVKEEKSAPEVKKNPAKKTVKYVYRFGRNGAEGNAEMRNLLGGKGANLAEM
ncbi:MAG: hypothetical protein IKO65_10160, partial [Victivallales bacterium]|nr:hypothetical protein [Victivallales bacterium]